MTVSYEIDNKSQEIRIAVSGRFDFHLVTEFRRAYNAIENPDRVIVDLKNTEYIDSSGLGILIYLRKHFNCRKQNIQLINCNSEISKTFTTAHFNRLFMIS